MKFKLLIPTDKFPNAFVCCCLTTSPGASHASPHHNEYYSIIHTYTYICNPCPSLSPFLPSILPIALYQNVLFPLCLKFSCPSSRPCQLLPHFSNPS